MVNPGGKLDRIRLKLINWVVVSITALKMKKTDIHLNAENELLLFKNPLFSFLIDDSTKYTLNMADYSAIFYINVKVEAVAKRVH